MSHASAEFRFPDGTVLYGEYDGTADIMLTQMFDTDEEMQAHWRKQEWEKCTCGSEPVSCEVFSYYGYGFSWPGKACLNCKVYCGPFEPYDDCPEMMKHSQTQA